MKQYPKQIFCLHSKGKNGNISFDMTAEMNAVTEETQESPLEIHRKGLSRFVATIKDKDSYVTCNIPAWDVAGIIKNTEVGTNLYYNRGNDAPAINNSALSLLREKAEIGEVATLEEVEAVLGASKTPINPKLSSEKLPVCNGRSPIEYVLSESEEKVLSQIAYLESGSNEKFKEANERQAALIREALEEKKKGNLENTSQSTGPNTFTLYEKAMKVKSKVDSEGKRQIYSVAINLNFSKDKYPWEVKIENAWARIEEMPDKTLRIGKKENPIYKSFNISFEDWFAVIRSMERTLNLFEEMKFQEMFEMAERNAWKPE